VNFSNIFLEILALVIYMCIGYFAKRKGFITESGTKDMSKIVVNIAMPLLVISSMNISYETRYVRNMITIACLSFLYLGIVSRVTKKLSVLYANNDGSHRELRYSMIFGNAAFLGYPLSYAIFGDEGMLYASIYVALQNVFVWTVGVQIYNDDQDLRSRLKNLLNPGLIAIGIGLVLFFFRIDTPAYFIKIAKGIGAISIPMALMVIGAQLDLSQLRAAFNERGILLSVFTKCLAFPALFLLLLSFTPFDNTIKAMMTIELAAPVQASAALFAHNFGGNPLTAAKCVVLSTIVAVVTIPLFLMIIT